REVVTPPRSRRDPVRVHAIDVDASTVTLARTTESEAPGTYTLVYAGGEGSCRIGEVLDESDRTVTRRFADETGVPLREQRFVRLSSAPERTIDDVGVPWRETWVSTELGEAPAWAFEAEGSRDWAIHVHGRGAVLTEPLRSVRLLRDEGWNSLVISYRNDLAAPASPDGKFGLGATESRDVAAAIEWAIAHGAERLLLVGWSMGGATVMQALLNSPVRDRIAGVVLESPVVSWRATLALQGRQVNLPGVVIRLATELLSSRLARALVGLDAPIPIDDMELLARAGELREPILLIHSIGDTVVPYLPSARLAALRPDLVTYEQFERARHVRSWNVDAPRWERAVRTWVRQLGRPEETEAGADSPASSADPAAPAMATSRK
ncbi:MAG: alpha/beta hydrolase, partial [Pseudoclavibacter sp.]